MTAVVVTENVADVCPAKIVTDVGTVPFAELVAKPITAPPDGAAPVKVTVPVTEVPPLTTVEVNVKPASAAGVTVKFADLELEPDVAVIDADVLAATPEVVIANVTDVLPAGTVTVG